MSEHLYVRTPLTPSTTLSQVAGCKIFLKLENFQPSGSFKYRGTSHLMQHSLRHSSSPSKVHFYCSSGGNAGVACATAAKSMNLPVTVVVPNSTSAFLVSKIRHAGAEVYQIGADWIEADAFLKTNLLANDPHGCYIPPFDNPIIWEGASSMFEEVYEQMGDECFDGVVCSVGGGSLLTGIQTAIQRHPEGPRPRVLAVETKGADSLNASLRKGQHVTLPRITSIATSLAIVRVAERAYELAQEDNVSSIVLSDAEAAMGSVRFAEDEDLLVEVSCGAALAAVYNGDLRRMLGAGMDDERWREMRVVVAVCGGSDVSENLFKEYRKKYSAEATSMVSNTVPTEELSVGNSLEGRVALGFEMGSCLRKGAVPLRV
ncbi:L-serine dehydratase [Lachnellula hyalina]|uniref:L-serine ammonia-lyase n=1 Tax=Lachnellula hyalina TaxID=1316788 RepID=A0A8H8U1U8_9HELO|nr:L-serine dehydratase [Lachnellula hyalina]TVY28675.1 L-serine dehydratase [Lachnellula hyalina]